MYRAYSSTVPSSRSRRVVSNEPCGRNGTAAPLVMRSRCLRALSRFGWTMITAHSPGRRRSAAASSVSPQLAPEGFFHSIVFLSRPGLLPLRIARAY